MPTLFHPIGPDGSILEILVGVSQARAVLLGGLKQPIPQPKKIRALVDTGASSTCVDAGVITELGYSASDIRDWMLMSHAGSAVPVKKPRYEVGVTLPHVNGDLVVSTLLITGLELESPTTPRDRQIYALIGRDILQRCVYTHDGKNQFFTLVW